MGYAAVAIQSSPGQRLKKAGFSRKAALVGAVTLIQRLGSALNLNVHFPMLLLDGVHIEHPDGWQRWLGNRRGGVRRTGAAVVGKNSGA